MSKYEEMIEMFGKRSDKLVIGMAIGFGAGGAAFDWIASLLPVFTDSNFSPSLFWGVWIPFCFITILPIHFLCRKVGALEKRLAALEAKKSDQV